MKAGKPGLVSEALLQHGGAEIDSSPMKAVVLPVHRPASRSTEGEVAVGERPPVAGPPIAAGFDPHPTGLPVAPAEHPISRKHAQPERDEIPRKIASWRPQTHPRRVVVPVRRRPRAVRGIRAVHRDIDHFRVRRGDGDAPVRDGHRLLRRALQRPRPHGAIAHPLHRVKDGSLIGDECLPQRLGPLEIERHLMEDVRKSRERGDAGVPGARSQPTLALALGQVRVGLLPAVRFHDFEGVGGGHQDLRQQVIREEGDGGDQQVELVGGQALSRCHGSRRQDEERDPRQGEPEQVGHDKHLRS